MVARSRALIPILGLMAAASSAAWSASPSFEEFDRRAKAGERLNVVFFGASLTWGANASDPVCTSYRPQTIAWLDEMYPKAHFRSWDAAIGGTGSALGVFRLERDVMRRRPDIVFLDFTANDGMYTDDPEAGASYESIVRRLIIDARVPVVIMIFPFQWHVQQGNTDNMAGREAHLRIAGSYNCPAGDAVVLGIERVKNKEMTIKEIWPADGVHPGDAGYRMFADAAKTAYVDAVTRKVVCKAPGKMLYAPTYMTNARVRISSLKPLPKGWKVGRPNLTAAWYDGLMSRWLDDETIVSSHDEIVNAIGQKEKVRAEIEPLRVRVNASMVMLFGEETVKSGRYVVCIDDQYLAIRRVGQERKIVHEFDACSKQMGGNRQHAQVLVTGLNTSVDHIIEIRPIFEGEEEQELRMESICVAGGKATVERAE